MANLHNFPTLSLDNPIFEPCSRHWAVAAKHRTTKTRDMPFVGILPSNWDLAWLHFTDARLGVASFIYRLLRDFSESIRGEKERSGSCCAFYMSPVEGEKISCIYVWLQKYKKTTSHQRICTIVIVLSQFYETYETLNIYLVWKPSRYESAWMFMNRWTRGWETSSLQAKISTPLSRKITSTHSLEWAWYPHSFFLPGQNFHNNTM